MGEALPKPIVEPVVEPAVKPQPKLPTPANDNFPPAANDNLPKANTRGRILRAAKGVLRANLVVEGWILVGRILFDPNVFGDNNAYFADTPTADAYEAGLVKQGEIDIKQNGMNPQEVRARVRREIAEHREKKKEEQKPKEEADPKPDENVQVDGKKCKGLADDIYSKAPEVSERLQDLMADKLDLYNLTRLPDGSKGSPHPSLPKGSGTWHGHIQQIQQKQKSLRDAIDEYDKAKCKQPKIPKSIRDLAHHDIPTKPGGTPGYPFNALPK